MSLRALLTRLAPMPPGRAVSVWPLTVRVFHWSLVLAVTVAAWTGFLGGMSWLTLHLIAGTAIPALIVLRVAVGLYGPGYARFDSFPPSRIAAIAHLRAILGGRHDRHLGHNPLGAMMVYGLMTVLLLIVLTGASALAGMFKQGPFRSFIDYQLGNAIYGLHQPLAWVLLAMIALHLGGVWFESRRGHENLVAAMIHGRKSAQPPAPPPPQHAARPSLAAGAGIGTLAVLTLLVLRASATPAPGLPPATLDADYAEQCGSCHSPFNPSLAPASVWQAILADLPHHFGQDASLGDPALQKHILDYLVANSAEQWDTLPAHRFMQRDPANPRRITATPYWKHEHAGIADAVFAKKKVNGRSSCDACHSDAESGRVLPENIDIPD
jgi:cytochrome b